MLDSLFFLVGGVGMFLLGMETMTAALRDAAGNRLRSILASFTTTPLRGVMTGAASTAVIQSSSATTVMTVGFVGAGLITMSQALGVVYGANIGTTVTGWLVSLLGFKLNLETLAMVVLLPSSLAILLGRGTFARTGRVVGGLCLLLIGLGLMQDGAATLKDSVTPETLPGTGFWGLIALAGIGVVLTVVMQSSSAAMALALVMLDGGAVSLGQAAAVVVGMNIGTTGTALLASVGGSRAMRQTAVANVLFNLATSALAFPVVWLGSGLLDGLGTVTDAMTALLLFHTGFNLVGTLVFLPLTERFAALVAQLVPEPPKDRLITLDRTLLGDPDTALLSAQTASDAIACRLFGLIGAGLSRTPRFAGPAELSACHEAIEELRLYIQDIRLADSRDVTEEAFSALLHQIDHLSRLAHRAAQTDRMQALLEDRILLRGSLVVGATLRRLSGQLTGREADRIARLNQMIGHRTLRHRRALLLGEHAGLYSIAYVFEHTDAMRWLGRVLHHGDRLLTYRKVALSGLPTKAAA